MKHTEEMQNFRVFPVFVVYNFLFYPGLFLPVHVRSDYQRELKTGFSSAAGVVIMYFVYILLQLSGQ
jgi:hypothetical protein